VPGCDAARDSRILTSRGVLAHGFFPWACFCRFFKFARESFFAFRRRIYQLFAFTGLHGRIRGGALKNGVFTGFLRIYGLFLTTLTLLDEIVGF
jgi:hypothetical protein